MYVMIIASGRLISVMSNWCRKGIVPLAILTPPSQDSLERKTCLHKAAEGGFVSTVRQLIRLKMDMNARDRDKETALHKVMVSDIARLRCMSSRSFHTQERKKSTSCV